MKEEIRKTYHENGNIKTERTFVNGVEHGPAKGWFESGELEFEAFKENGLVQGLVKNYYENGNLSIETNYIDQVKQGYENSYSENGDLVQRFKIRDGEVVYNHPINLDSFQDILSSGYTNIEIYRKEIRDNNLQEIEINWLQDLGKIYKRIEDKPVPYVLFHNPKYENDNEYLCIFVIKEIVHPELIIDQIINNNGGSSNFTKLEDNNEYNYCFQGHLFWLGYLDNKDFCVIEINRIKHELTSSDDKKLLDGIHKDSKEINFLINGLDSLIYNSGEMVSGDGRLCYGYTGMIVSYWSDPKKLIKRFKNIAKNYQENIYMSVDFSDFEGKLSKYADLNETEIVKYLDDERFHMQIKTKDFEISVSKGTSSYQMNINILTI